VTERPGLAALTLPLESLSGRCVLVTGGSRGIGRACATAAAAAGARVVISGRDPDRLAGTAAALQSAGLAVSAGPPADVADGTAVDALVAAAVRELGQIDGVVHAAAVPGPIGPAVEQAPDPWWEAVRVNLLGTFLVLCAVARVMTAGGRMVALSGGGAAGPFPYFSAYGASKAAVVRLVETLAHEWAGRIEVNALAPGFVATDIHQATLAAGQAAGAEYLERTRRELSMGGVPPDLAGRAAVFLLSARSAGITGRLLAAPWDDWWRWPDRREQIADGDLFTLRRIVPRNRGDGGDGGGDGS
jgi:NAD(P)-dependent dehydrogenase (short-subunit alcohol dehydrogenase family)